MGEAIEDGARRLEAVLAAIRALPDPYAWAASFRRSRRAWQDDTAAFAAQEARQALAADMQALSDALFELEITPSHFLYRVVDAATLAELSDDQVQDPEVRAGIAAEVRAFRSVFEQADAALAAVQQRAYRAMGEDVIRLRRDHMEPRRRLLDTLERLLAEPGSAEEIRQIGQAYLGLIDGIAPLREAMRDFAEEIR